MSFRFNSYAFEMFCISFVTNRFDNLMWWIQFLAVDFTVGYIMKITVILIWAVCEYNLKFMDAQEKDR